MNIPELSENTQTHLYFHKLRESVLHFAKHLPNVSFECYTLWLLMETND